MRGDYDPCDCCHMVCVSCAYGKTKNKLAAAEVEIDSLRKALARIELMALEGDDHADIAKECADALED